LDKGGLFYLGSSVLSRQWRGEGCDLGGFVLGGVPSYPVTKGGIVIWGFCPVTFFNTAHTILDYLNSALCTKILTYAGPVRRILGVYYKRTEEVWYSLSPTENNK